EGRKKYREWEAKKNREIRKKYWPDNLQVSPKGRAFVGIGSGCVKRVLVKHERHYSIDFGFIPGEDGSTIKDEPLVTSLDFYDEVPCDWVEIDAHVHVGYLVGSGWVIREYIYGPPPS
ncbi:MAG: hypothetical protein HXS43_13510, partial [Theionarchaea archaeon]|nr:hypothetical protein [Theionarchaea archaeon]